MKTTKEIVKTISEFGKDPLKNALKNKRFVNVLTGIITRDYECKEYWGDTSVWDFFLEEMNNDSANCPYSFIGKRAWKKAAKAYAEEDDDTLASELYDEHHDDIVKEDLSDNFLLDYEWPKTKNEDDVRDALTSFVELYKEGGNTNFLGKIDVEGTVDDLMTWVKC